MDYNQSEAELYMRRCFQLAKLGKNDVRTNPIVGAAFVHNNRIIGEGYHQKFGEAHAEINALKDIKKEDQNLIPLSDVYVSLEPCSHQGKTQSCAEELIRQKVKRVFVSCKDPNPKVSGEGIKKLQKAGIQVIEGILNQEGKSLIEPFVINQKNNRPYIILKYAQSKDGYIGKKEESVWLSNQFSRVLVHKWRSESDAILIGANTARLDNPKLNVRFGFKGKLNSIILDKEGSIPADLTLLSSDNEVLIVTEINDLKGNFNSYVNKFDDSLFPNLMSFLISQNIGTLIVEGGGRTLKKFVKSGFWDEARIFRTNINLDSGIKAPNINGRLISSKTIADNELLVIKRHQSSI